MLHVSENGDSQSQASQQFDISDARLRMKEYMSSNHRLASETEAPYARCPAPSCSCNLHAAVILPSGGGEGKECDVSPVAGKVYQT